MSDDKHTIRRWKLWVYLRTPVDGGWKYDRISQSLGTVADVTVTQVPAVGDQVHVPNRCDRSHPSTVQVVARRWGPPGWGSVAWPFDGTPGGPIGIVDLIVEPAEGLFADEVFEPEDEDTP